MNTENFIVDDCSHWEAVEALYELLPKFETVPSFALIVKSIDPIDGATLVVASKQEEVFRVLNLVCHHEADHFQILLASIHIVTQEQVVGLRWEIPNFENSK